jgi:hypothetical protein
MHRIIFLVGMAMATPAHAESVAVESAVYSERHENGAMRVAPAVRLSSGDRVVTILTWKAPSTGRYTAVSAVPPRLAIQSTSREGVEISTDGGRSWQALTDTDFVPSGITHLRWPIDGGDGRLSYRAVVR